MKTAYSYVRFSTPEQAKGDSLRRQLAASKKWCDANGYTLSKDSFFDRGKSAYKGEHLEEKGELKKFLSWVESGKIAKGSVLLVENVDRLTRLNTVDSITLFFTLIKSGIGLVFTQSYDAKIIDEDRVNKDQYALTTVIGECVRAHSESKRKSELIIASKQAKREKMRSGEIVAHNNVPKYFTFAKQKYVHNDNTKIVKRLVDGILAGKSLYSLADTLNAEEIKTFRRGYQWSGTTIRSILRNKALMGEYLGNKNYLPEIIPEATFQKIQNILNNNSFNRGAKGALVNVFRGICFCSDCGKKMQVATQCVQIRGTQKVFYRYLRCSTTGISGKCKNRKHIKLTVVERLFFIGFLKKTPYAAIKNETRQELKLLNASKNDQLAKLHEITSEIIATTEVLRGFSIEELKSKLAKLLVSRESANAELDSITAQIVAVGNASATHRTVIGQVTQFGEGKNGEDITTPIFEYPLKELETALLNNSVREQIRVMLPSLIDRITVDTEKGKFYVLNRLGRVVFESPKIISSRNRSDVWKESLQNRKLRNKGVGGTAQN